MRLKKFLATTLTCALTVATALGNVTNASADTASSLTVTSFAEANTGDETIGTTADVTYTFHDVSTGSENWDNFLVEVYNDEGVWISVRADAYGWLANQADSDTLTYTEVSEDFDWASWNSKMKSGQDCTARIVRNGSSVKITVTAAGSTFVYSASVSSYKTGNCYVHLTGENCKLTNIKYGETSSSSSSNSSEEKDTSLKKGDTFKVSGNTYKVTKAKSTVTCTKCTSSTIPATVKDSNGTSYKVTAIAAKAAKGNKKLKTVTIGSNVTSIGANAFAGCTKLTTVKIKTTSKLTIGKAAFKGDKKLTKVSISSKSVSVGKKAFKGASSKAKVTMPLSAL